MGTYTELIFGAALREDTPRSVIDTLKYLIGKTDEEPQSMVFQTRSGRRFCGSSYYFGVSSAVNRMWFSGSWWHVSIRCSLKNYDNEIEDFLDWIRPYVEIGSGENDMYAIVMCEDLSTPEIYYLTTEEQQT